MKRRILLWVTMCFALVLFLGQVPCLGVTIDKDEFFVKADTGMNLMVVAKTPKTGRLGKAVLLVHGSGVGYVCWDIPIRDYSIMDFLAERGLDLLGLRGL